MSAVALSQVTVALDAFLTDTSNPNNPVAIAGEPITFSYKLSTDTTFLATNPPTVVTDSTGHAVVNVPNLLDPDSYDFTATFSGDAGRNFAMSSTLVAYTTSQTVLTTNITEIVTPANPGPTDTLTVNGLLTSMPTGGGSTPLPGQPVMIIKDGSLLITVTTQSDGTYIYSGIPTDVAGSTETIAVTFPSATGYNMSSHTLGVMISGGAGPPPLKPVNIVVIGIVGTMFGLLATIGFLSRGSSRKK